MAVIADRRRQVLRVRLRAAPHLDGVPFAAAAAAPLAALGAARCRRRRRLPQQLGLDSGGLRGGEIVGALQQLSWRSEQAKQTYFIEQDVEGGERRRQGRKE